MEVDQPNRIESVYRSEADKLWRALVGYAGDKDVANDALAEAFTRALENEAVIRDVRSWLWRVSFRVASAELRRRTARNTEPPTQTYEMPETVPELMIALQRLTPNQRLAVILCDYADRPTEEVAKTIGCSRATVHVHLSKARRKLRSLLEEDRDA